MVDNMGGPAAEQFFSSAKAIAYPDAAGKAKFPPSEHVITAIANYDALLRFALVPVTKVA